ncbi:FH2 domain containing 3 isoform 2-T3 [Pholidichthys leucotaenia]
MSHRPVTEIVQDIHQGNWLKFGDGKLKELSKLLPEESEVKLLLLFSGNLSVLPEADQFMVQLVKVPGYEERLKMMVLREEFFPLMEEVKTSVAVMTKAANELLNCDNLHSVIRLVLKAGNYMNAGGHSSNVIGFRMTSLLKLADTKANKPGMNLMHYVAKQAEYIDAELLTFPNQLEHIRNASRICKEEVISDFEREVKKVKEVKLYSSRHPGLVQQMETFLLRAEERLSDVELSLQDLKAVSNAVAEYFCEDPATFKLEECCSIFDSFCKRFQTAVQENGEREAAEQRHKRRESMRVATKHRTTASGSGSKQDGDASSLESALHNFLTTVPARPRRNATPTVEGSPSVQSSQAVPVEQTSAPKITVSQDDDEVEQLLKEDAKLEKKEAKRWREITRKACRFQSRSGSCGGDGANVPCLSVKNHDVPDTPKTSWPRTREYFFSNNGDVASPWTILSPFMYSQRNDTPRMKKPHQRRLSSTYGGDNADGGVWETEGSNNLPDSTTSPSEGSASLPKSPSLRSLSQGPVPRSLSLDETRQSSTQGFKLCQFFQKNPSQRSLSTGSKTEGTRQDGTRISPLVSGKMENVEGQVCTSGLVSFFRRIGVRAKPGDSEEQTFKGSI